MPDTLHSHLKRATEADHADLDAALVRRGFFASRAGYVAYLQGFWAFQSAAEQLLSEHHAQLVLDDWPQRRRAALVQADLQSLGAKPETVCTRHAKTLLVSRRPEHLLGTAYVLEGATLGGAVVLEALAPLGITAAHGGRFLASYGEARALMWRRFLGALAAWDARGVVREEAARAARAAFGLAAACFSAPPAPRPACR